MPQGTLALRINMVWLDREPSVEPSVIEALRFRFWY